MFASCGTRVARPRTQLRIAAASYHESFDPYHDPFEDVAERAWIFGQGLVGRRAAGVVPDLALEVPTVANGGIGAAGTEIVYLLREDVRWHDGRMFRAEDVVAAFHRLMRASPAWRSTPPYDDVASIDALDGRRVRVRLRRPHPDFVAVFFAPYGALPIPVLRGEGRALLGTAPFRIERIASDRATFVRGDASANIRRVTLEQYPDMSTAALALKTGDLDAIVPVDRTIARNDRLRTVLRQSGVVFLIVNTKGALHARTEREALLGAIDADEIAERIFGGARTDELFPGAVVAAPGASRVPRVPMLDIAFARSPAVERIALLVQDQLKRAGVKSRLRGWPLAGYEEALNAGRYDLAIFGGQYAVAEDAEGGWTCASLPPNGINYARLCDPKLDAAFARGDARAIGQRLGRDAVLRILARYDEYAAVAPYVRMPQPLPFAPWFSRLPEWSIS